MTTFIAAPVYEATCRLSLEPRQALLEPLGAIGGADDAVDLHERRHLGGELCIFCGVGWGAVSDLPARIGRRERSVVAAQAPERVAQARVDRERAPGQSRTDGLVVDREAPQMLLDAPLGRGAAEQGDVLCEIRRRT